MTAPRGRGSGFAFLDFDGVLHHQNCLWHPRKGAYLHAPQGYELFQHAELLADQLKPFPEVQIVLSTSWVLQYGLSGAAKRLPEALRARVIGGTFHSRHMQRQQFQYETPRGLQVYEDVMRRRPRDWIALDDCNEGWPPEARGHFIQTDETEGISAPEVLFEIKEKLLAMAQLSTRVQK
jgi:hypothetical protein